MAVSYGASGAIVYSTGNPAAAYPTGITAGQMLILEVRTKPDDIAATTPSGWTFLGAFAGGAGTTGIDVGPTRIAIFYRIATGSESGSVTVTVTGNNVSSAQIHRYTKTLTNWDIEIAGGVDSAGGAAWSISTDSLPALWAKTGDMLHVANTFPTDTNPTWSVLEFIANGGGVIQVGAISVIQTAATTSGQDLGGRTIRTSVTSSSMSAGEIFVNASLSGTTTNAHGPVAIVRIRDEEPVPPSAPTSAPTVTPGNEQNSVFMPSAQGGATSYDIYANGSLVVQSQSPGTIYTHTLASAPLVTTNHSYTIRGRNSAGVSTDSPASANYAANPLPPSFSLAADDSKITVTITRRAYAAVYKVYRGLAGGARSLVHTSSLQVASGTYTWEDTGLTNGQAYDYHVTTNPQTPTVRESTASSVLTATPTIIGWSQVIGYTDPQDSTAVTYTSGDGINWTYFEDIPAPDYTGWVPTHVIYDSERGRFYRVTTSSSVSNSIAGGQWTEVGSTYPFNGITRHDDRLVAVGNAGRVGYSTSPNSSWTIATQVGGAPTLGKVASNGHIAVAVAGSSIFWSNNLTSWSTTGVTNDGSFTKHSIEYGNGYFVAVGDNSEVRYSQDGKTWTVVIAFTANATIRTVHYDRIRRKWFVGTDGGYLYSADSPAGEWTDLTTTTVMKNYPIYSIYSNKTGVIAGGALGMTVHSPSGNAGTFSAVINDLQYYTVKGLTAKVGYEWLRPSSTTTSGWSLNGTTHHEAINSFPYTSATYVESIANNQVFEVALPAPSVLAPPQVAAIHIYGNALAAGSSTVVSLKQGTTTIASFSPFTSVVATATERIYELSAAQCAAITDPSNLRLHFTSGSSGATQSPSIIEASVEWLPGTPLTPAVGSDTLGASVTDVASVAKQDTYIRRPVATTPLNSFAMVGGSPGHAVVTDDNDGTYLEGSTTGDTSEIRMEFSNTGAPAPGFAPILRVRVSNPDVNNSSYAGLEQRGSALAVYMTGNFPVDTGGAVMDVTIPLTFNNSISDYTNLDLYIIDEPTPTATPLRIREVWLEIPGTDPAPSSTPIAASDTLTASVSDTSSPPVIVSSITANDTLNASVTDTSSTVITSDVKGASDTLTASLTDVGTLPPLPQMRYAVGSGLVQGVWTGSHLDIDETVADDLDYIESPTAPTETDFYTVIMGAADQPGPGAQKFRFRYAKNATGGRSTFMTVNIRTGNDTQIAAINLGEITSDVYTTYEYTLTQAEADAIVDYSDVRLRFDPIVSGGGQGRSVRISWAEMELPAAQTGTINKSRADTLTATVTETASVGTVVVSGSDSLSANVTETSSISVVAAAADTLTAALVVPFSAYLDDFNRANQTGYVNAFTGSAFAGAKPGPGHPTSGGTYADLWEINTNRLRYGNVGQGRYHGLLFGGSPVDSNGQYIQANLYANAEGSRPNAGLRLRSDLSGANGYSVRFDRAGAVTVLRTRNDTTTSIGTGTVTWVEGALARVEIVGDTITVLYNGSQVTTVVDALITAGPYAGIYAETNNQAMNFENLEFGSTTGTAAGDKPVISLGLSGSDTLSGSVTETTQFATVTVTGSDTLIPSVTESAQFATVAVSASDTVSASVGDTANVFVNRPGEDSLLTTVAETSNIAISGLVLKTASDGLNVSLGESTQFATVAVAGPDTLSVNLTESIGFETVTVSASVTLTASVSESTSFGTVPQAASDTLSASVSETRQFATIPIAASDSLSASVSEARQFATITVSASDTLNARVTDSGTFSTVSVQGSDTLSTSLTEGTQFATVAVTASESPTVSLSESVILHVDAPGADALNAQLSETTDIVMSGDTEVSANDNLNAGVAESVVVSATLVASDGLNVSVSETTDFAPVAIEAADTLDTTVSETTQFSSGAVSSADTLSASVSETSSFSTVAVVGSDTLSLSVTEAREFATIPITASDTLNAGVSENTNFATVTLSSSDTLSSTVTEGFNLKVTFSSTDSLSLSVTDSHSFATVEVGGTDTHSVSMTDTASVAKTMHQSGTDNLNAAVVENVYFETQPITASDDLTVVASDTSLVSLDQPGSDSLVAVVTEESSVLVSGQTFVEASDTFIPTVVESTAFDTVQVTGSDDSNVSLSESVEFATVTVESTDTLDVTVSDSGNFPPIEIAASDSLGAAVEEAVEFGTQAIVSEDTLLVTLDGPFGPISDDFNRVNIVPVSPSAEGWRWATILPTTSIVTNALSFRRNVSANYVTVAVADVNLGSPDMFAEAAASALTQSASYAGPMVRVNHIARAGYMFRRFQTGLTDISSLSNGVATVLWSGPSAASTDILRLEVVGNVITGYINGVQQTQFTNDTFPTGNYAGAVGNPVGGHDRAKIDNFVAGALSGDGEHSAFEPVGITASDSLEASATETSTFGTVAVTASDTLVAQSTETTEFATVEVVATDQADVSITDAALVHSMDIGSDALIASVTEESSVQISGGIEVFASDTADITLTETSDFATTEVTASDTLSVEFTETGEFSTTDVAASDTISVYLTETGSFDTSTVSSSDTLAVEVTDHGVPGYVTIAVSDSLTAAASETTEFATVAVASDDTLAISADESVNTFVDQPGADILIVSLAETSSVEMSGGVQVAASDTLTGTAADASETIIAGVSGEETFELTVTDTGEFATVEVSSSDALTVSLADNVATLTRLPGHDSLAVIITEEAFVLKMVDGIVQIAVDDIVRLSVSEEQVIKYGQFGADTLSVTATEQVGFSTTQVGAADIISARVTETREFGQVAVAAADTVTARVTDASTLAPIAISATDSLVLELSDGTNMGSETLGTDSLSVLVSDQGIVEVYGLVAKSSGDTLSATVDDIGVMDSVFIVSSDTLRVVQHTGMNFETIQVSSSDNLVVSVADVGQVTDMLYELSAEDLAEVYLVETVEHSLTITTSDNLVARVTEQTSTNKANEREHRPGEWIVDIEDTYFSGYQGKTRRDRRKPTQ